MIAHRLKSLGLNLRLEDRPPPARPGWEPYLVAQRGPEAPEFPPADQKRVLAARAAYEAGTHEMFTVMTPGRWTQLYLRPRKQPAAVRRYFTRESA